MHRMHIVGEWPRLLCLWCVCTECCETRATGNYLLTPWCRVLLEKLTGLQLVKKFPAFHGTRRFITALTSVRHLSLSWASPFQSIYLHPTSWRSILILCTHLRLGLPSGLLPSGFPTKTLHTPLSSPICATCPALEITPSRFSIVNMEAVRTCDVGTTHLNFKLYKTKPLWKNICPYGNTLTHSDTCLNIKMVYFLLVSNVHTENKQPFFRIKI